MEEAQNSLNIIVLDACRNNPFARSFRSSEQGLAKMDAPTGSILAYATAPGSVAADGTGTNGLYTEKLLKHMSVPGIDLPHLFMPVRKDVVQATSRQQVPWESSSLIGDFYFIPKRGIAVVEKSSVSFPKPITEASKVASIPPAAINFRVVARDRQFEKYNNGIVRDLETNLEWFAGPDTDTNWDKAKAWVESLNVAGGGWRMPTRKELKSLYQKGAGSRNISSLLETTGWWVWSGEMKNSSIAWGFSFFHGFDYWDDGTWTVNPRGFAVRAQKIIPELASVSSGTKDVKVVAQDGRYIAYENGTVEDTQTGLMWAAKDNGENINWKDAKRYCETYRGGGYTDWRMPTLNELAGLYDQSKSYKAIQENHYNIHLTKLIELSTCCPWASGKRGHLAAYLHFNAESRDWIDPVNFLNRRALPVRSVK